MKEEIQFILDISERIFAKNIDHKIRLDPEKNHDTLIKEIRESHLTKIAVKEKLGGAGMNLVDIIPLIKLSAFHGVPIPFVETIIGNYFFSVFDKKPTDDFISICYEENDMIIRDNKVSGLLKSIPYLNFTNKVMAKVRYNDDDYLIFFENKNSYLKQIHNFLAEPRYDLEVKNENILFKEKFPKEINFLNILANLKSIQATGAMEKILQLCIDYCSNRKQFGRALSKFQMIQNHISEISLEIAASGASISVLESSNNIETNRDENFSNDIKTAIAKIRTGLASGKVIALSHQVHGAMGFTKEYDLSYFTKNLNSWRNDFGTEIQWQNSLGNYFLKQNKNLWEFLNH